MFKKIDVAILCGGFGTRLKSISGGTPKSLMRISTNKVFLDLIIEKLVKTNKISKIYLCTHFKKKKFEDYIKNSKHKIFISNEDIPLGTSGAIKNLFKNKKNLKSSLLIINGDSFSNINIKKFIKTFFTEKKNLIAFSHVNDTKRYGNFKIIGTKIIKQLHKNKSGWINNGYYLLNKNSIRKLSYYSSLEKDLINKLNYSFNISAFKVMNDNFVDIGTTNDYFKFIENVKKL
jgi:D-glycero-alpha-D-manno-heptose 1-phosphate guanylyltransferase